MTFQTRTPTARFLSITESLIRDPSAVLGLVRAGGPALRELPVPLAVLAMIGFTLFGALLGLTRHPLLALVAGPKLCAVGLGSLAISLPALHIYGRMLGSGNRAAQSVCEALVALAVTGVTLIALAPVWLVYAHFAGDPPYGYFRVMLGSILFLGVAGARGVWTLLLALRAQQRRSLHLVAWGLLYGLVGLQAAWVARPFVGMPGTTALVLVRPLEESALDAANKLVDSTVRTSVGLEPHGRDRETWFE